MIYLSSNEDLQKTSRILALFGWLIGVLLLSTSVDAQVWQWPSELPPKPLPVREMTFPPYDVRTLSNGLQVVTVLQHEQPAVSIRLLVRAGSVDNPPGRPGVASFVASLLDRGTSTRSAQEIADTIDTIGGALGAGSGSDLTFVNAVVMKDSFGLAMELIGDLVRNPAFAQEEIERQRQQTLSELQVSQSSPEYVANVVFDRLVYGFHPYGFPNRGTPNSLNAITRKDLEKFHHRHFMPNNMILALVGDLTHQEAFATTEQVFGSWSDGTLPTKVSTQVPPPVRRVVVIDKPDAVQTEIRVGQLGIMRKHSDYMAVDMAFKILGGEGANRLHRILRSERGLTYGASVDFQALKHAGLFMAETDTRTEATGEVLGLILDEINTLRREFVGARELADAQAYLAGNFPLTIETPDAIATKVLNALFYELPVKEISTFPQRIKAVTSDDIQRVARTYIFPKQLSIVLVGRASGFLAQLSKFGFGEYEVIPIEELDFSSASLRLTSN